MKKTAQQIAKQLRQEPQEIAKSALTQISGQETKSAGGKAQMPVKGKQGAGFKTQQKRIQKLNQQDKLASEERADNIREQLGISAPSETTEDQTPQASKAKPKAPAISSPYTRSLKQQVEDLRQKVKREDEAERARQAREAEQKKRQEKLAKQELLVSPSARPKKVAPWARKIKSGQGPGETRPSFGKQ